MRLNEDLFQRSTATRHHLSTDRKSDHLTWTHTAPMGFTGWSQRDTLTTGHGYCRDNRRQHTAEVEQIMRTLAVRGLRLHAFGAKVLGLGRYADTITSSDSMAWSMRGRHVPGCSPSHRTESNCLHFALQWHAQLLTSLRADGHNGSDGRTPCGKSASRSTNRQPARGPKIRHDRARPGHRRRWRPAA